MKRLECLDGLRGALATYVLLGHMAPFAVLPDWLQVAVSHGGAAVDVFFMLSGLVITQSLDRMGGETAPFLLARATRIFPVFLLVFALALLVQPMTCGFERMPWIAPDNSARTICGDVWPHHWPGQVVAHLTMSHGLLPNGVLPDAWVSFLGAAWSLSTEWQFYLVTLLLLGGGQTTNPTRLAWTLLLLGMVGAAWRLGGPDNWQFSRAFLGNKAHFFALGVASFAVVHRRRGALWTYVLILAATLAFCGLERSFGKLLPPLIWSACLAVQLRPQAAHLRPIARALRSRVARYLGATSYCVYLVNEPIHKILAGPLSRIADGDAVLFTALWLPTAFLLPIAASAWLHRYVEVPALRWGREAALAWSHPRSSLAGE